MTDIFIYEYRLTDNQDAPSTKRRWMKMESKIVCDGKECATINWKEDVFEIKCTQEGKYMCKEFCRKWWC